jgi:hypothetical protein
MSRYLSLEFVRVCCVQCRRERVVIAFWAEDSCSHGATCAWGDGLSHPAHEHGALARELVR